MALSCLTDLERSLLEAARQHQLGSCPKTEILFCVAADGRSVIDAAVGQPDKVELTAKMMEYLKGGSRCKMLHNHPSNGSISSADWRFCLDNRNVSEIIAVNPNGSIFRGAIQPNQDLKAIVRPAVGNCFDGIVADVEQKICNAEKFNPDNYDFLASLPWTASDICNQRLLELDLIQYEVKYGLEDSRLLCEPAVSPQIVAGKCIAAQLE